MNPTDEQARAVELFQTGGSLAIEAGAGTGKTSTLVLLAEAAGPRRRGQYVAFNKSIVEDSARKFPASVQANTAHSLAYRAVGFRFRERLSNTARVPGWELAKRLGISDIVVDLFDGTPHRLAAGFLAGHVQRAITQFCQTADLELTIRHFPYIDGIDRPTSDGRRTFSSNNQIANALLPIARRAWDDLQLPAGIVPYRHEHYLKAWQLGATGEPPFISADYILFDEAQDANPVMAAIVAAQADHAQLVYVGDSQQEIYGWTGAVNALASVDVAARTFLTMSFRFGQAIADSANEVLEKLDAELRIVGNPALSSTIGTVVRPAAILTRTNAVGIERLLQLQQDDVEAHFLGGSNDILAFAKAARDLMTTRHTGFPALACFDSWAAVQEYVANDQDGEDLALNVRLVDRFGPDTIIMGLENMVPERMAEVVISTAHKAKGRQWQTVQLAQDFRPNKPTDDTGAPQKQSPEALRLMYVAQTRAQMRLDLNALGADPAGPYTPPVWGEEGELVMES